MRHFRLSAAALAAPLAAPLAALGLALGAASIGPAAADQPAGMQLAQGSYSDEKLQSFAMAALEIQEIRSQYMARMEQAESEEQRQQLAEKASDEMVGAVQSAPGITVDEYNEIIEASAENPELSDRINQYMQSAAQ